MVRKIAKAVAKSVVRTIQRYIQYWDYEERQQKLRRHDYSKDEFASHWLNFLLTTELLTDEQCAQRAPYGWGVLHAAHLASAIGINRISVLEFGVAGGNGLVSLERIAQRVEGLLKLQIDVYGFDTGRGLPKPEDYRDLPNLYVESAFAMDVSKLKNRLSKAQLRLGLVRDTITEFIKSRPAPVGFVAFDLDYYSSTMDAFKLFEADAAVLLPRIHCYFDDIMGFTFSEFTGERLAITDFNNGHPLRNISPIYGLRYFLPPAHADAQWSEMMYLAHFRDHPLYERYDGLVRRNVGSATDFREK